MGKATRLRRERADGRRRGRALRVVFFDVDYARSSRAHGRGSAPAPPEGWVIERSGLIHGEWDGEQLRITSDELIGGRHPASALIDALALADLVVGHGILTGDLRTVAMVTDVPDTVLRRTVDLLALAHRLRGGRYPTGCNLSALAVRNEVNVVPLKQRFPSWSPGLGHWPAPYRGAEDPRDDAAIAAALWQSMLTTRRLAWGTSASHMSGQDGSAALEQEHVDELTGRRAQPEAAQWRERVRAGRVLLPTAVNGDAALLAGLSARDLPAPVHIRALAHLLAAAGHVPPDRQWSEEELYTACQYLGTLQNIDARERIDQGRELTKLLRRNLVWALWQIAHPQWTATFNHYSRLAYSTPAREGAAAAMLRIDGGRVRLLVGGHVGLGLRTCEVVVGGRVGS